MNLKQTFFEEKRSFLAVIVFLQFLMVITVVLDILIARQVIGFLYLTFIPGFIILRILKIDKLDMAENTSLSIGLSIVFLMIVGLLTNELGPLIGVSQPLSIMPLMVALNGVLLVLCFLLYLRDKDFRIPDLKGVKLEPLIPLIFCLPLVSIAGVVLVNASPTNNFLLLLLIVAISGFVVLTFSKRIVPHRLYPLLLVAIGIALLFHSSLISNHLNGFDIQHEYKLINRTMNGGHWISSIYDKFQSLLSVTILPTIYSNILNMEAAWVLKIIYPLIFSFVPLVLYKLYRTWVSEKIAFLSTFFFMANYMFFTEMLTLGRQMVAELFYVLLFFTLFNRKIFSLNKVICFTLFGLGLVFSHYAISYVFLFIIFLTWLSQFLLKKNSYSVKTSMIVLYSVILFSWYIYISSSGTFDELLSVWNHIRVSIFTEFFNVESRGGEVLVGLGMESPRSLINLIGRVFAYATQFLIVIGFLTLMIKRKKKFGNEYIVISSLNIALLAMCIILPAFAGWLGMGRFYHVILLFFAPLCILGAKEIFRYVSNSKNTSLVLGLVFIVLVPYFLFQTGLVYEVTGEESWSIPLSKYRFDWSQYLGLGLIEDHDISGVKWLTEYNANESARIYADAVTGSLLVRGGYGMVPEYRAEELLSNATEIEAKSIVYLRWANIVYGIMGAGAHQWNTTEYVSSTLNDMNKIYSNGGCEIYKNS